MAVHESQRIRRLIGMVTKELFGYMPDGQEVYVYTLQHHVGGIRAKVCEFGGTLMSIEAPDKNGCFTNVLCGYDSLKDLMESDGYVGALIGRFGNRIGGARFTLEGKEYTLYPNNNGNTLHGGKVGFSHTRPLGGMGKCPRSTVERERTRFCRFSLIAFRVGSFRSEAKVENRWSRHGSSRSFQRGLESA